MALLTTGSGVRLRYESEGDGPAVLFVHGWLMSGAVWHYQRELAGRCRLITMDLRGHGQSGPGDGYTVTDLAGDLVELADKLELEQLTLVGWSLGAQVALAAVPRLSSRLAGLVLVGGTPRFCATGDYPHGLPAGEARGMGLRLRRNPARTAGEFFHGMFAEGEVTPEQYREIARTVVVPLPPVDVALATLEGLAAADLRPLLPQIQVPTLLVHGTTDAICLPGASAYMAERLPDARLQLWDGIGHAPFLSRHDRFNQLLAGFLEQVHERH